MNLNSSKDKILLKNCIVLKLKELNIKLSNQINHSISSSEIADTENSISYYTNLYEILKSDDSETLIATLDNSLDDDKFGTFSKSVRSLSAKDFSQEYIDLIKTLMEENQVYSDEKFDELKKAFYKGNEDLNPDNNKTSLETYEEEPEQKNMPNYLTDDMKISLDKLNKLTKQNSTTMSASDFKKLSAQFRDITLVLGISKFQQSFDEQGKTIEDMNISYDTTQNEKSVYKADLKFSDSSSKESNLTITEPASTTGFSSTYFQNLCHSYLEANKYANIDESLLDSTIISSKMSNFRKSYEKLDEMMTKCKFTISNHYIIPSSESNIGPSELELDVACNSEPEISSDDKEIEI